MVRIRRSHRRGRGSIPRMGVIFLFFVYLCFLFSCLWSFFCLQVGTGFSFTNDSRGFSTDETEVAVNLYSALTQFFMVFSEYQANDFYITGEVHNNNN